MVVTRICASPNASFLLKACDIQYSIEPPFRSGAPRGAAMMPSQAPLYRSLHIARVYRSLHLGASI